MVARKQRPQRVVLRLVDGGKWAYRASFDGAALVRDSLRTIKSAVAQALGRDDLDFLYSLGPGSSEPAVQRYWLAVSGLDEARHRERSALHGAIDALVADGVGPTDIASLLGVSRQALAKIQAARGMA